MLVHYCFQYEHTYIKRSRQLKTVFVYTTAMFCIASLSILVLYLYFEIYMRNSFTLKAFIVTLSNVLTEERCIMINAIINISISTIRNLLKCLNNYILNVENKINDNREWNDILTVEQVEQWATQYKCILSCSRSLSVCFKVQVKSQFPRSIPG